VWLRRGRHDAPGAEQLEALQPEPMRMHGALGVVTMNGGECGPVVCAPTSSFIVAFQALVGWTQAAAARRRGRTGANAAVPMVYLTLDPTVR
jgi:hypothetical protein